MKPVTAANVDLLDFPKDNIIKLIYNLQSKIDTIYTAYRQCYSADPTKISKMLGKTYAQDPKYICSKKLYETSSISKLIKENMSEEDYTELLYKCWFIKSHSNHESPLEHSGVSVRITDASRCCIQQWTRHRLCAHSQQSQRYLNFNNESTYVVPATIDNNSEAKAVFINYMNKVQTTYDVLSRLNIPEEDIRYIFPNAFSTQIVTTMNFRNWNHLFAERCCTKAQREIRIIALKILKELKDTVPFIFENSGAKCNKLGYCPEDKPCKTSFEKNK